ncbi:DUF2997 domain-containing protein [Streptomyces sp. NPDC060194]|uniref:DUF2997 domain-containing protein n=1 Tax=Streptomyces sp. NPDC060194 TaxID=3347069 RepID=UPI0036678B5D
MSPERIVVRISSDGSVQAETEGMKGSACLNSIELLEDLLEARTADSAFTPEYDEEVALTADTFETEGEADELRYR